MKFTIAKELLVEAFSKVEKPVKKTSSNPILHGFYFEITKEKLTVIGSDNDVTLRYEIPVDNDQIIVEETGITVVPPSIKEMIKKVKTELLFSLEGHNLIITHGKKRKNEFKLITFNADEYPKLPILEEEKPTLQLKGNEFLSFLSKIGYAASTSETRPVLQGICLDVKEDCINLVATDSHRLGQIKLVGKNAANLRLIIPAKVIEENKKAFDLKMDVFIYCLNDRQVVFKNGDLLFYCRLLEGTYPDTSRLIPSEFTAEVKLDRKEFLDSFELVKGVSDQADSNSQGIVKIDIKDSVILSTFQAQTGSGKVEMEYESLEGDNEINIALSAKYMVQALKAMDDDYINFKYQGNMRPLILEPCESQHDEVQLILPVRSQ